MTLLHLTVNVVEIITESHANWFSDRQIIYMKKKRKE